MAASNITCRPTADSRTPTTPCSSRCPRRRRASNACRAQPAPPAEKSRLHQLTRMCGRGLVERLNSDGRGHLRRHHPGGRAALDGAFPPPPIRPAPVPRSPHPELGRPARRHLARSSTASTRPDADGGATAPPGSAIASASVLESSAKDDLVAALDSLCRVRMRGRPPLPVLQPVPVAVVRALHRHHGSTVESSRAPAQRRRR